MQIRRAYRKFLFIITILWSALPVGAAERKPLIELIEIACEQGQTAESPTLANLFGFNGKLRIVQEKNLSRSLFVPASQCDGNQDGRSHIFAISYAADENIYPREVHWYLISSHGELIRALRSVLESPERSNSNWLGVTPTNTMRAEFESEKRYWLTKYGLPAQ